MAWARRLPSRLWHALARRAWPALRLWLAVSALAAPFSAPTAAAGSVEVAADGYTARFEAPTDRYGHAIMGDLPEWGRLCLSGPSGEACVTLPETSVFEDIAPRLSDLDHDGIPEAVVIESSIASGAALVVYRLTTSGLQRIATPPIGTRNRWLAPLGTADLDGDGHMELAYIDRPHLAKTLRIWRYRDRALTPVAAHPGLTNHRIGEPFISGGIRDCGSGPEIVTADASWRRLIASTLETGGIATRDIGPFRGPESFTAALACR